MKLIYDLAFLMFAAFYLPYLLIKGKFHAGYMQRLSFLPEKIKRMEEPIWIHAVSVGEAMLALKLAGAIKENTSRKVVISTTTTTGQDILLKDRSNVVDASFYYPCDLSFVVSRVIKAISPGLFVLIETEIWPNMLRELKKQEIPVILANGRISEKSFRNYMKISFFTRRILRCIDVFCMQAEKDAERIECLGAETERLRITGNMKFDEPLKRPDKIIERKDLIDHEGGHIVVAGSTHSPEETIILEVFRKLKEGEGSLKLILAPRHIERAESIRAQIKRLELKWQNISDIVKGRDVDAEADIILVDTIGHLKGLYALADISYIGGSMVPKGGQNPIEAAMWKVPVVFGRYMFNFRSISEEFLKKGAALQVEDPEALLSTLKELLNDPEKRKRMGARAQQVLNDNRGAVKATFEQINELLKRRSLY